MSQNIAKSIVLVSALAVAGGAAAFLEEDAAYSAGFGVSNSWMKGKNVFRNVVAKSYPQTNVFAGMRCEQFGVELGYTFSKNKKNSSEPTLKELGATATDANWTASNGGVALTNVSLAAKHKVESKSRVQGFNLDFLGYMPAMNDSFEVFGLAGLGFKKAKVNLDADSSTLHNTIKTALKSAKGKNKVTFRVGAGASYMVTDVVGLRGKAVYETTSKATVTGNATYNKLFKKKMFKDNYSLGLDLFVKF